MGREGQTDPRILTMITTNCIRRRHTYFHFFFEHHGCMQLRIFRCCEHILRLSLSLLLDRIALVSLWYYAPAHRFCLFRIIVRRSTGLAFLDWTYIHGRGINGHRRINQHRHNQYQQIQFIIMYKDLRAMYFLACINSGVSFASVLY